MARKTPTAPSMRAQNTTEKRMMNGERLRPWLAIRGKIRFSTMVLMMVMAMMMVTAPTNPFSARAMSVGGIAAMVRPM